MDYVPSMRQLNVPEMTEPILENYNQHVKNFVSFLHRRLQCHLIYEGPEDLRQHILQGTVYACSVYYKPKKILKDVFPVMIGSALDLAIRHAGVRTFKNVPMVSSCPFQDVDIARGFFIINGLVRQVPYFFTNDPSNMHVIQKKIVRVYTYDANDRGKELSYYIGDSQRGGKVIVVNNDGSESADDSYFFHHCPYPTNLIPYMFQLYSSDQFDIDHLGNKIVVSPGHLFVKLFIKYLYGPLREQNWSAVKSKLTLVRKSIDTGCLLHVLSRKTQYFKEGTSAGKMTNAPQGSHREIGANGEVFVEKSTGCYRDVNMQTFPLNPFLLYLIVRQISQKVKVTLIDAFHPSYLGFLCILGCFETKNVGRTTMMVRNTIVTSCDAMDPIFHDESPEIWKKLNLQVDASSAYYVVVNEACVPVTRDSFDRVNLFELKQCFGQIECYQRGPFKIIRYKVGLIMKRFPDTDIWVTPYDEIYWAQRLWGFTCKDQIIDKFKYDYILSYLTDLNQFFQHNAFPKNILAFNALKNAILATTPRYAKYFMDTVSAYIPEPSFLHEIVLPPANDDVSKHFVLKIPRLVVAYTSFMGCTQEDCIVRRRDLNVFDCCRFYTLRFKWMTSGWIRFYPVQGDPDESDLLGTVVSNQDLTLEPFSIHVRIVKVSPREYNLHFSKPPFRVLQYFFTGDKMTVSVEQEHVSSSGDKLCSLHGQKGVMRIADKMLTLDETTQPDLLVNPYSLFRMTIGQIKEGLYCGGGRDALIVRNSDGQLLPDVKMFYARTFYFPIAYFSSEHLYAPEKCRLDKVLGQAVKGRSRGGGMRLGNMELFNAMRGNGIASCFEEKFFEDGDRIPQEKKPTLALPKSINLVQEDARFFKCNLEYETVPSVTSYKPESYKAN